MNTGHKGQWRERAYWACQITGWFFYGTANVVFAALFQPKAIPSSILLAALGLGFTHLYRGYVRRVGWMRLMLGRLIPRVLLASLLVALAMTGVMSLASLFAFRAFTPAEFQVGIALIWWFNLSATVLLWSLIYFGLHYFWNYKQGEVEKWKLEAAVKEAEIKALKSQLNPHFLFNSLNSIRALIAEDPARAQQVVTQLAALLRYALQAGNTATVPLAHELHIVRTYLELEAVRLEGRLQYEIKVDETAGDLPVPAMLVQTLVENGIKHGVAMLPQGGQVRVEASRNGDALRIRVDNSGHLSEARNPAGVGLRNAQERLRLLFGEQAALTLAHTAPGTVTAEVHIPLLHVDRRNG